jgi:hypothetical protein
MKIRQDKVKELMDIYEYGNYNRFSKAMGLDPSHLHRFINTGVGGGKKLFLALMAYCKEKGLDISDYIDI